MNICIIVYSKTGHTLSLANKLKDKLDSLGHNTTLAKLGDSEPDISKYNGLVIATPVHGASPAEVVKDYLEKLPSLEDKKAICLATSFFPAALGRNQTLKYLKEKCEEKGAKVCDVGGISSLSFGKKKKPRNLLTDYLNASHPNRPFLVKKKITPYHLMTFCYQIVLDSSYIIIVYLFLRLTTVYLRNTAERLHTQPPTTTLFKTAVHGQ